MQVIGNYKAYSIKIKLLVEEIMINADVRLMDRRVFDRAIIDATWTRKPCNGFISFRSARRQSVREIAR